MNVAAILTFDGQDLLDERGSLPRKRLRQYIGQALDTCERYRQRLAFVPGLRQPVWVDDHHFDLDFHLRWASLPSPGGKRELNDFAGRVLSQKLDRSRPLWEIYLVDGLANEQVAMVIKAHHAMVDGVAGMQLLMALLRPTASKDIPDNEVRWNPRPVPTRSQMFRDELRYRVDAVKRLIDSIGGDDIRRCVGGLRSAAETGLPALVGNGSPFTSPDSSPYRRFESGRFSLDEVKAIKASLGGTVNDVVLAVASGAARRHLDRNGASLADVDALRAVLPVHTGSKSRNGAGNQVAMVLAELPIDEVNARSRMRRVVEDTQQLKHESHQVEGAQLIEELADVTSRQLLSMAFKLASHARVFDMIITNVRGPNFPVYLLGAQLRTVYPVVPLLPNQNVGIALFSYNGGIHWGINADWDAFPEAKRFMQDLSTSFEELKSIARENGPRPREYGSAHASS